MRLAFGSPARKKLSRRADKARRDATRPWRLCVCSCSSFAHACGQRINNLYLFEDGWYAKVNYGTPSGCEAEKPMAISERRAVTVLLTEEHLRKMIEDHLLQEDEIGDRVKIARIVQKLLDAS